MFKFSINPSECKWRAIKQHERLYERSRMERKPFSLFNFNFISSDCRAVNGISWMQKKERGSKKNVNRGPEKESKENIDGEIRKRLFLITILLRLVFFSELRCFLFASALRSISLVQSSKICRLDGERLTRSLTRLSQRRRVLMINNQSTTEPAT